MRKLPCLAVFLLSLTPTVTASDASVIINAEYVSEYVFRGVTLAGEAIQPSVEVSFGNLTVGTWLSLAIGEQKDVFADEIDLYVSSRWELADFVSGEFGATIYHFPDLGNLGDFGVEEGDASTLEIYGGLDFDMFLSPTITAYHDLYLKSTTVETSISYSIAAVDNIILTTSANVGLVASSEAFDYQYAKLSAKAFFDVTERASLFAGIHYGMSTENTFLDTDFDLSDPASLKDPTQNSRWFSIGVASDF